MGNSMFQKAVKGKKPLRLVISGASGAGKSWTALDFCKWLESETGKRTAALDTEHGRLSLYADKFDFDVIEIEPPFNPKRLVQKIKEAEEAGYGQLIVDSSTHFWNGSGGILEIVTDAAKTRFGGNQYAGWSVGTPLQNEVIDTVTRTPLHVIFTTRAKQEYLENEKGGKKVYEKTGMGMVQREGFEYDFDFAIMMDMDNNGLITKGMGLVPPGTYFKHPSRDAIEQIMKSIRENSVDAPPRQKSYEEQKEQIASLYERADAPTREKMLEVYKKYTETGNPNKVKDVSERNKMISELISL